MIRVNGIKIEVRPGKKQLTEEQQNGLLRKKAAALLRLPEGELLRVEIVRRSLDARKKPQLAYSYVVDLKVQQEKALLARVSRNSRLAGQVSQVQRVSYVFPKQDFQKETSQVPIVIVGMGPAGLFCGYFLALHGFRPILLERGRDVDSRRRDVETFWQGGKLLPNSNVQFGEGGAGTFSDGKLNTQVKDKYGRNRAVLETFVRFGAPETILYEALPHIGTDVLGEIVKNMRREILRLGGSVRFESCVTDILTEESRIRAVIVNGREELPCSQLVLATGHSARDTFSMLYERGLPMEAKAFAVGLRAEHDQKLINEVLYGCREPGSLGAAPYKVAAKTASGRGVYSFCMCPGGYVVNASSEEGRLAVNGMSYSGRSGSNANSALIVNVTPADFPSQHPLAGVAFQRELEERAFLLAGGKIPVQRYGDFKEAVRRFGEPDSQEQHSALQPQCKGQYAWADLSGLLPRECSEALVEGMEVFGRQIAGFDSPDTILSGVESRTSSPVRILRDGQSLQTSIAGIYPCGEGAGYAGGITSAAMDGLRVAEAIAVGNGQDGVEG